MSVAEFLQLIINRRKCGPWTRTVASSKT